MRAGVRLVPCLWIVVVCFGSWGCGSNSADGDGCQTGTEQCPCYRNGTCNEPFVCYSDLCVLDPESGSEGGPGAATSSGWRDSPAPLGESCEPCEGTTLCLIPVSAACGGADCLGTGQQTYCTRDCTSDADCGGAPFSMKCLVRCVSDIEGAESFVGKCLKDGEHAVFQQAICDS